MIGAMSGAAITERRELHKEQMIEQAAELDWLKDPSLIPDMSTSYLIPPRSINDRCLNLAQWMIDQFATWATLGHERLGLLDAVERHNLNSDERNAIRQVFQFQADHSYGPGMAAVSEVFAVTPAVATRDSVDRTLWLPIASQAREFAKIYARDGTVAQSIVRGYLDGRNVVAGQRLSPARLKLDSETGITSVTPIQDIVATAKRIVDKYMVPQEHSEVCIALQANPKGLDSKTMWDAVWNAYGSATERLIYSVEDPDIDTIPEPEQPDGDPYPKLLQVLKIQFDAQRAAMAAAHSTAVSGRNPLS